MKIRLFSYVLFNFTVLFALSACEGTTTKSNGGLPRFAVEEWIKKKALAEKMALPIALPQVGYRIDETRYFQIVPRSNAACEKALVYYVDEKLGIYSYVIPYDAKTMNGRKFQIDAANDSYLGAPVSRFDIRCARGNKSECDELKTAYSTDAGRNWKFVDAGQIGNQTITKNFFFDTGFLDDRVEFRNSNSSASGKFFDMDTPYKYYYQVWVPFNPNTTNAEWNFQDYPRKEIFYLAPMAMAIFGSENAPKFANVPALRKPPLDSEFACKDLQQTFMSPQK